MQDRKTSLGLEDEPGYPYFAVTLEGRGIHHFEALDPVTAMDFYADMESLGIKTIEGDTSKLRASAREWRVGGASIGLCWSHNDKALAASRSYFDSLLDFGAAVIRELHQGGYTVAEQGALMAAVVSGMGGVKTSPEEVKTRAGFSEAPEGGIN